MDGLLLIGHDRSPEIIDYLEKKNIPALVAWAYDPKARLPSIGFDNFKAMSELAEYILNLGHKRIGMISAWTKLNDRARARVSAVRHIMSMAGLDPNELSLIETVYSIETGATAFNKLMKHAKPPTVVICGNDVLAAGALKQAQVLGMSIPRDVSITGFDGIDIARTTATEITTVHVPHHEMGKMAAGILIKKT